LATGSWWQSQLAYKAPFATSTTIGRMGGDEFVVLIDGASLSADPELVADRLLEVIRQPFEIEGATTLPLMSTRALGSPR